MSRRGKRKRGRLSKLILLLAAAFALLLWRCGYGLGVGGGGDLGESDHEQSQPQPAVSTTPAIDAGAAPAPAPCRLRLDKDGLTAGTKPLAIAEAPEACRGGAVLTITGDARYGDATALRRALTKAGIEILERTPGAAEAVDAGEGAPKDSPKDSN